MKVFFDALGCPKALVDAERMCYFLQKNDHELTFNPDEADAIVVNTCGFIEKAKKESINTIINYTQYKKKNPDLKIIVSGCLSERYKKELLDNLSEVDSAIGVRDPAKIIEALNQKNQYIKNLLDEGTYNDGNFIQERSLIFSGNHYAYLKISEGCDRICSFCAIPSIRGKQRSRKIEHILTEADFLLKNGIKELIIISEDTLSYGTDIYGKKTLPLLLKKLTKLGFDWIRIMYLFPETDVLEIAAMMNDFKNICRYMDIPLQHASRKILKSMKRPGGFDTNLSLIEKIRKINPEIRIRSSFIIGFPGETEDEYQSLRNFLVTAQIDRAGFFEYSNEEGTEAFLLKEKVNKKTTRSRIKELSMIQEAVSGRNLNRLKGKTLKCINDGFTLRINNKTVLVLRSEFDAPEIDGNVYIKWKEEHQNMAFLNVKIDEIKGNHDLSGAAGEEI